MSRNGVIHRGLAPKGAVLWKPYFGSPFLVSVILIFLVSPILGYVASLILGFLVGPIMGFEVPEVEKIQEICRFGGPGCSGEQHHRLVVLENHNL